TMATVEERMKILKMIEEGKISAEDGAKLLAALAESRKPPMPPAGLSVGGGEARWFRVRVTDMATGKTKVNVNIPMGLVNVGIKMGARFAPGLESEQMEAIAEALKAGMTGKIIDVTDEEDGEHVEIFVE
ncbi:MAG: SHOCT-like domain-containing protein, partial [Anaerolineales bacterium]